MPTPTGRIRALNDRPLRATGSHVIYWMTAHRRVARNFALQRAVEAARDLRRPLIVLEALRCDYPWASDRLHRFVIDGMADQARALDAAAPTYLPYVEPEPGAGRGLLAALAGHACLVVTDDFPCFFLPRMTQAAAGRLDVRLEAVDSNGLLPVRSTERIFVTAHSFRAHLQRVLPAHLGDWPERLDLSDLPPPKPLPAALARRWPATPRKVLDAPDPMLASLPIDHSVPPAGLRGGARAAREALDRFVASRLARYDEDRNHPDLDGTSGLSPYLHFGHISAHEVFETIVRSQGWTRRKLAKPAGGKREGWWGLGTNVEAFLDQLITWRELGLNGCALRPDDYGSYSSLPAWARSTLEAHRRDRRKPQYGFEALDQARTHDDVWNAAQRQLVRDGWMHNYLRMLWGKKILEWTPSPEAALDTMVAIMDRYAIDGRDPNSYAGYLWTLGRYDRPWGPARSVFGTVRYMSSDSTRRKIRLRRYLQRYGEGC